MIEYSRMRFMQFLFFHYKTLCVDYAMVEHFRFSNKYDD